MTTEPEETKMDEGYALLADLEGVDAADGAVAMARAKRRASRAEADPGDGAEDAWKVPDGWTELLGDATSTCGWDALVEFVDDARTCHEVYPPPALVFEALRLTAYEDVRVVILGQDPYHGPGQAHGLCFSVPCGVSKPPAVRTIHRNLAADPDLDVTPPAHGNLEGWARQGVLLLNTALTVRRGVAGSHAGKGWEAFTDEVIRVVSAKPERVVFILWGVPARAKKKLIDTDRHTVIESTHPTSRGTYRATFDASRPFSETNRLLEAAAGTPIDWADV